MNDLVRAELLKLYDGDKDRLEAFVASVDATNRTIEDEGLIARSTEETQKDNTHEIDGVSDTDAVDDSEESEEGELPTDVEMSDELMDVVVGRVVGAVGGIVAELKESVANLSASFDKIDSTVSEIDRRVSQLSTAADDRLRHLETDDEQKLEAALNDMPKRRQITVTYRPRHDNGGPQLDKEPSLADRAASIQWPK